MSIYVIGIDGSETAAKAAARAGELAAVTDAELHVVCAYSGGRSATVQLGADSFTFSGLIDAEQTAEAAGREVPGSRPHGDLRCRRRQAGGRHPRPGPAGRCRSHRDRQLRMQGAKRVLGAVANDILHHAPCDVLCVKTV